LPYVNITRFCIFCLLTSFISSTVLAGGVTISMSSNSGGMNYSITSNRPWGNFEEFKPGLAPPVPPPYNHYLGASPGTGWYYPAQQAPAASTSDYLGASPGTGWYYPAQQAPAATTNDYFEPRVEIEPVSRGVYERQNIVYTVRVVSSSNLKTLNPVLPYIDGATLELVKGPVASARQSGRTREIINQYRFKLMPLRPGEIIIPPIRFTGTHLADNQRGGRPGASAERGGSSFSIAAEEQLTLDVFPANPAVKPWLPLHDLKLQANLSQEGPVKAGTPVTLTLDLTARGAIGNQLPSLYPQLQSDGFRAYRDSVTLSSGLSNNGKQLLGGRKETYTLIPLQDGPIYLPGMAIAWWDVDTDSSMLAELVSFGPGKAAASNGQSAASTVGHSMFPTWFWAPLLITIALIAGFWLGAWARTLPLMQSASVRMTAARQELMQRVRRAGRKMSPLPYISRLSRRTRHGLASTMPGSMRLWLCTRCIEHEDNPAAWCVQFRERICDQLKITAHTPLPVIAERLIEASPQTEAASMRRLVHSLDSAIYGSRPLDFPAWKKELRKQLKPRMFQRPRTRTRRTRKLLPALNPHRA
jgi:hypothetical protein